MKKTSKKIGGSMGGSKSGGFSPKGRTQREVLDMLTGSNPITIPAIASRRQTSVRAVYSIIWKLKKQGFLSGSSYGGFKTGADCGSRGVQKLYNLHAQRFIIPLFSFDNNYYKETYLRKVGNKGVKFRGVTIKLRRDCVEIYSVRHFKCPTIDDCEAKSGKYWAIFLSGLETRYGVRLDIKEVKETYSELAMLNNGIAYRQNVHRDRLFYYDQDTGRLWLKTDQSFKGNDLEFVGVSSKSDARLFEKHLKDWRDPLCPTPLEFRDMIGGLVKLETLKVQKEYASQQQSLNTPEHIEDIRKKHKDLSYFG